MSESGSDGSEDAIAILGGTGDQGLGLALRFARAGRNVLIGSRKLDRAVAAAKEVLAAVPDAQVVGLENAEATKRAPIVILSVPFEHGAGTVKAIRDCLSAGQIVVSMVVMLRVVSQNVSNQFRFLRALLRTLALAEPAAPVGR